MPSPLILSWGELLWDLFPDGPRLGGGAANVAVHAHQWGARSALVSRVGDDEPGRRAVAALAARGVDTELVQVDASAPTGAVHVELQGAEPSFRLAQSAAWDRIELSDAVRARLSKADVLCFGTLAQRTPLALGSLTQALQGAPAHLRCVCDLNVRLPHTTREAVEAALAYAHVVKLNRDELAHLGQLYSVTDPLDWLLSRPRVELVALTLGSDGAELVSTRERVRHPGFAVAPGGGDAVGAGDAFTAVLAVELTRAVALASALEHANRYASWVASQPGAMPPPPAWLTQD